MGDIVESIPALSYILSSCRTREERIHHLEEHLAHDKYATAVCHNETTYSKLVKEKIVDKRDWLLNCSAIDQEYDDEARGIVCSMSLIGLTNLDCEDYTTAGRLADIGERRSAVAGIGIVMSGLGALASYLLIKAGYGVTNTIGAIVVSTAFITAGSNKLLTGKEENFKDNVHSFLTELRQRACFDAAPREKDLYSIYPNKEDAQEYQVCFYNGFLEDFGEEFGIANPRSSHLQTQLLRNTRNCCWKRTT